MENNNKGFTLVELLAVIVIMGILMMVAIPSVTRTIENSRKDTFVDIAKSYGNAARTLWTSDNLTCNGVVSSAVDDGDYYILINSKSGAKESLPVLVDQGGKSSWGNRDVNGYVRVNISTTSGEDTNGDGVYEVEPRRVTKFYVALSDGTHGLIDDNTLMVDELKRGNVVMTLAPEQLKKIEFTLDDGKLNCSRDVNGRYSCTNVTPIKNMTGVCVDDNTTVATVTDTEVFNPTPSSRLPEGAYYVNVITGQNYSEIPATVTDYDVFLYGDYLYCYSYDVNEYGWVVRLATEDLEIDGMRIADFIQNYDYATRNQETYDPILEFISNKPVASLYETFKDCTNLRIIPQVPAQVMRLHGTFENCNFVDTDLSDFIIPNSVKDINNLFYNCTSITAAPVIPASVTTMHTAFRGCTSLTGTITINANPSGYSACFYGVDFDAQNLTLVGQSTILDNLGLKGSNYCENCNGKCHGGH